MMKSVEVPLFHLGRIVFVDSLKKWKKFYQKHGIPLDKVSTDNAGVARYLINTESGERVFLVGVFDGKVSTLAHEAAHTAFFICDVAGVSVRRSKNNETFCYLVDFIVDVFAKELKT